MQNKEKNQLGLADKWQTRETEALRIFIKKQFRPLTNPLPRVLIKSVETVEVEIKIIVHTQRVRAGGSRIKRRLLNGPQRAQPKAGMRRDPERDMS